MKRFPAFLLLILFLMPASGASAQTGAATPTEDPSAPSAALPSAPGPEAPQGVVAEWQARLELGRMLLWDRQYDDALAEFRKVMAERPESLEARVGAAEALAWSGRGAEAEALLAVVPPDRLAGADLLLLADLRRALKNYAEAVPLYRRYLETRPGDLAARFRLAETLSWQKKYAESLGEFERILAAAPDDRQVRRRYAQVLEWAGRRKDAIKNLQMTLD